MGQSWFLIASIPNLCLLTYFKLLTGQNLNCLETDESVCGKRSILDNILLFAILVILSSYI